MMNRRHFLRLGGSALLLPAAAGLGASLPGCAPRSPFRLGVIADLHHGLAPSALDRLSTFMQAADVRLPDALLQLGDFNYGTPESRPCTDLWNQFAGPRHHVLGNHDMDFTTKAQMLDAWEMPAPYYAFDRGGYHFVVLDRNNLRTPDGYVPYANANFYVDAAMRGHADPEQLEWLRADLAATDLPTVVFVHQGLGMQDAYEPGDASGAIEAVFDEANRAAAGTVVACFCGHHHIDRYNLKHGIHYVWLNSASYYWVGEEYGRMAPYTDALFTFLSFHPNGVIEVEGRQSEWASPTPADRGFPEAESLTPFISYRSLHIGATAS